MAVDKGNVKTDLELFFFSKDPTDLPSGETSATVTDNVAFVWGDSVNYVMGRVQIAAADWFTQTSEAVVVKSNVAQVFENADGDPNLYVVVITSATPTFAVGDLIFRYGMLQEG